MDGRTATTAEGNCRRKETRSWKGQKEDLGVRRSQCRINWWENQEENSRWRTVKDPRWTQVLHGVNHLKFPWFDRSNRLIMVMWCSFVLFLFVCLFACLLVSFFKPCQHNPGNVTIDWRMIVKKVSNDTMIWNFPGNHHRYNVTLFSPSLILSAHLPCSSSHLDKFEVDRLNVRIKSLQEELAEIKDDYRDIQLGKWVT